jgi:hypothetical protein
VLTGVNGVDRRPGKDKVNSTKSDRGVKSVPLAVSGQDKDGRRVEGDDVDAAHLLGNHDGETSQSGAPDSRDGEQPESGGQAKSTPNRMTPRTYSMKRLTKVSPPRILASTSN